MLSCNTGRAALIVLLSVCVVLHLASNTEEICAMMAPICYDGHRYASISTSTMQGRIPALGAHDANSESVSETAELKTLMQRDLPGAPLATASRACMLGPDGYGLQGPRSECALRKVADPQ